MYIQIQTILLCILIYKKSPPHLYVVEVINGGEVHINLTADGIPVMLDVELCQALQEVGVKCNIPKGREQKLPMETFLPDFGISVSAPCYNRMKF